MRMTEESSGGESWTPAFASITAAAMQAAASSAYLTPLARSLALPAGEVSHMAHDAPAVTSAMPAQAAGEGRSLRKTTASSTVRTGPSVPSRTVSRGPSPTSALK